MWKALMETESGCTEQGGAGAHRRLETQGAQSLEVQVPYPVHTPSPPPGNAHHSANISIFVWRVSY
jgi:hypothetical protein